MKLWLTRLFWLVVLIIALLDIYWLYLIYVAMNYLAN